MVRKDYIGTLIPNERAYGVDDERNMRHDKLVQHEPKCLAWVHYFGHLGDLTKVDAISERDVLQPGVANLFFEEGIHEKHDFVPSLA